MDKEALKKYMQTGNLEPKSSKMKTSDWFAFCVTLCIFTMIGILLGGLVGWIAFVPMLEKIVIVFIILILFSILTICTSSIEKKNALGRRS